ncbi:GNAT family N-acetyltransferase [Phytoactinopolyspora alkaliphila]|uniref:GNAT family N-acetyltransferase n=1 Tax=Phytoactinopolyspora alkaliphila TaxID=1783498 RepID=A0A6N9YSG9_9ACTN|nr:GNAT family N-acetyltransferase [Phytoactinopolyspora alkaliphila]NED97981.1 GNAT family N-acetyltransferase [Phytoactinopolyspora alkaliphila]
MNDVTYRTFARGDTGPLVELIARGMPHDAVSRDWFTEFVLLDPNFDPDGLIVAADTTSGRPVGFVYAVRGTGSTGIPVDPDGGWVTIGVVDPDVRRCGIGTELISRATEFLRSAGAAWTVYSGYPPAYFLPGLDAELYPDGLRLLERAGFRTVSRPVAMSLSLSGFTVPDAVSDLRATREAEGYTFGPATGDDLPDVMAFARDEIASDWGEVIRSAVVRSGRPERVVLARTPDNAVAGFAIYGAYRGVVERFGPFGVAEQLRGLGLGKIILHETLRNMRDEGATDAWFLWTGPETPAGRLYLSTGFSITRTFHVMRADLSLSGDNEETNR